MTTRDDSTLKLPLASVTQGTWPGMAGSPQWPETMPDGSPWPRISIVTPSYNQGQFLERTLRSVLSQGYPNLEYIIIDGGSTDNSVEIIRRYEPWLAYWVSQPDRGMYDAINKGFARSTGEVMAWLNSDDMYTPWALQVVAEIFAQHRARVHWLSGLPGSWTPDNKLVTVHARTRYNRRLLALGAYRGGSLGWVQQESTFWSRTLWEQVGGCIREEFRLAGDFDLWRRFALHTPLYVAQTVLSGFRTHGAQQTAHLIDSYHAEVERSLQGVPAGWMRRLLQNRMLARLTNLALWGLGNKHIIAYNHAHSRWMVID